MSDHFRLVSVVLDDASIGRNTPNVEHEREVAIFDLLEDNSFRLADESITGPFNLRLSIEERRLIFDISTETLNPAMRFGLSLSPFRRVVKDYFLICESYFDAIKKLPPSQIEAIDMGRRGLHDEGSRLLMERLDGKIVVDFDTARRLFTLVCALQWKG